MAPSQNVAGSSKKRSRESTSRRSRAKFPKHDNIIRGPDGTLHGDDTRGATPRSQCAAPSLVASTFEESYHLDLDYEAHMNTEGFRVQVEDKRSRHARRRQAQNQRWMRDVFPLCIRPFLAYKRHQTPETVNSTLNGTDSFWCSCETHRRVLKVTCVRMESALQPVCCLCSSLGANIRLCFLRYLRD